MAAIKSEMGSLFVRPDEDLSSIIPKFSRAEINSLSSIRSDHYGILGDLDGHGGVRYTVKLPKCELEVSVCRTGENNSFYGDSTSLINEYTKNNPDSEVSKWVRVNARELNIAKHYWEAVNLRESAESLLLQANIRACEAKSYVAGSWGLSGEERKLLITEFGYDPDRTSV